MQPAQATVDLRISLNFTREFGMVISAGLGGIDADLDEGNFRQDRAAVYAAAELTDAAGFFRLFQRTLGWQRLAAIARRDGLPLPDQACAGLLRSLAGAGQRSHGFRRAPGLAQSGTQPGPRRFRAGGRAGPLRVRHTRAAAPAAPDCTRSTS
jgi:hypothetical protein